MLRESNSEGYLGLFGAPTGRGVAAERPVVSR